MTCNVPLQAQRPLSRVASADEPMEEDTTVLPPSAPMPGPAPLALPFGDVLTTATPAPLDPREPSLRSEEAASEAVAMDDDDTVRL